MNIEEALRHIREKGAVLRYLGDSAAVSPVPPDPIVLAGVATVAGEVERLAERIQSALNVSTLDLDLSTTARRR